MLRRIFIDRHLGEGRAEKIAIECGETRVSYRQLFERTNQVGNALRSLGVRIEERVLLLLLDTPEFAASFFGVIKIGAVAVPFNTLLKPTDYKFLLNNSRARVAVIGEPLFPLVQAIPRSELRYLETVVVVGSSSAADTLSFEKLLQDKPCQLAAEPTSKDDAAFWLYSSGSTGKPKACVHLQHDMVVSAERYAKAVLNITEKDRFFSVAKLFFAYGLGNGLYFSLAVGATSILLPDPPRPQSVFEVIERHPRLSRGKVTVTDGPFSEAKEVIGGYAQFELASKEEAVQAAVRFMELHRQHWPEFEGETEVRQMFGPEDFKFTK